MKIVLDQAYTFLCMVFGEYFSRAVAGKTAHEQVNKIKEARVLVQ